MSDRPPSDLPPPDRRPFVCTLAVVAAAALASGLAGPASAQLIGGRAGGLVQGLGQGIGGVLGQSGRALQPLTGGLTADLQDAAGRLDPAQLLDRRAARLQGLARANPRLLELDEHGFPALRGEVVAASPSPASLSAATGAGFVVERQETLDALGLTLVVLKAPEGMSARQALQRLRKLDPDGRYDYDHLYVGAGEAAGRGSRAPASAEAPQLPPGARLGLIDTGVDAAHPAFAGESVEQKPFAPGGLKPAAHGTAVASLMVGRAGPFHGAAPGAALYAADVYGPGPAGGAADMIVRALAWLAEKRVRVVNVSLVGPPNTLVEAAVSAASTRGVLIVAPVGNDGPAAPPAYPASYPEAVAVTGVDGRRRALIEAGRAGHVDFAAPGADMAAAWPGGRYAAVRGTSFAAPIVAGELARRLHGEGPAADRQALEDLAQGAVDLGARGPDPVYGRGLVGEDVRIRPAAVGARPQPAS